VCCSSEDAEGRQRICKELSHRQSFTNCYGLELLCMSCSNLYLASGYRSEEVRALHQFWKLKVSSFAQFLIVFYAPFFHAHSSHQPTASRLPSVLQGLLLDTTESRKPLTDSLKTHSLKGGILSLDGYI